MVQLAWHFIIDNWSCISVVGLIGYLLGSIVTRKLMAPQFCPRCIRHNQWIKELKNDPEAKEEENFITNAIKWMKNGGK